MNYWEALHYITALQKNKGSDYSLEPVRKLCELAGNPDRTLSIIHIAGTNGKGSIGSYLGNILALSGYTVGRYVSPTLLEYRERIQRIYPKTSVSMGESPWNGGQAEQVNEITTEYISEQETAEILTNLRNLAEKMENQEKMSPTAFEIETVMALMAMKQWKVDVAIVECGMGGRMDATNIIAEPKLCVFSHISLDHTAFLGETVEEIATEKAGILKPGSMAVSVKQDKFVDIVLQNVCQEMGIPLYVADVQKVGQIQYDMEKTSFCYQGAKFHVHQRGSYQIENALTAIEAAQILRKIGYPKIQDHTIQNGLAVSRVQGRFECVSEHPYVLVDGAHNPQAAVELRRSLEIYFQGEAFSYIFGVFRDKDYMQIAEEMLPLAKRIYTVKPPGDRGLEAKALAETVEKLKEQQEYASGSEAKFLDERGNKGKGQRKYESGQRILEQAVQACSSVEEALDLAVQEPERVLVFGSLSFLHEVYEYFDLQKRG